MAIEQMRAAYLGVRAERYEAAVAQEIRRAVSQVRYDPQYLESAVGSDDYTRPIYQLIVGEEASIYGLHRSIISHVPWSSPSRIPDAVLQLAKLLFDDGDILEIAPFKLGSGELGYAIVVSPEALAKSLDRLGLVAAEWVRERERAITASFVPL